MDNNVRQVIPQQLVAMEIIIQGETDIGDRASGERAVKGVGINKKDSGY